MAASDNTSANNKKHTNYVAKKSDDKGYISYTEVENRTWHTLITRQLPVIQNRACQEYLDGLEILQFSQDKVPQLIDVNKLLFEASGWQVAEVPALISFDKFFNLLANRKFPAATFIRTPEELDYLQEPDIFHELFGHCPMLTNQVFADYTAAYGKLGVGAPPKVQKLLARLYWFTVEFGLININNNLKIYGGGILSSIGETGYSLDSNKPLRQKFDPLTILRTPYRIDVFQATYFIINSFDELYGMMNKNILNTIDEALKLGELESLYPPKNTN